jgi:beta-ribofuranosylaminobenzene 5'-phosphate synthase
MTAVQVSTPSRLHFGLLRLHESAGRSFGGLGMMIDRPRVELQMSAASEWRVTGPESSRASEFAVLALQAIESPTKPSALAIAINSVIPQHRGLGGGTQLALAIAASVRQLTGLGAGTAEELAAAVGRAARSAVGTHGFLHGGLIWELGRAPGAALAELAARVALPSEWRVVLLAPPDRRGLSGAAERRAFDELPPVPPAISKQLETIAETDALPAATAGDCDAFGEAVYRYGRLAGECFASVQGGPYASPEVAACVARLRELGVRGVGQSSWGPTVFAIVPEERAATELTTRLRLEAPWSAYQMLIAAIDNRGAIVANSPLKQSAGGR